MKIKGILIGFMLVALVVNAQKQAPCQVTLQGGNTIEGYIKRYKITSDIGDGFKLFKDKKSKIAILPEAVSKVVVNDTTVCRPLVNKKGSKSLMQELIASQHTSLYLHLIRMSGGIPGEGFSTWFINDFYMKRDAADAIFVDEKELFDTPETYFPNAPELCAEIRATKKKDSKVLSWVEIYNGQQEN